MGAATLLIALALAAGCSSEGPPEPTPMTGSLAGVWSCGSTAAAPADIEFKFEGEGRYGWFEGNGGRIATWLAVTNDRLDLLDLFGNSTDVSGHLNVTSNNSLQGTINDGTTTAGIDCGR